MRPLQFLLRFPSFEGNGGLPDKGLDQPRTGEIGVTAQDNREAAKNFPTFGKPRHIEP